MEINLAKPHKTLILCSIYIAGTVVALLQSWIYPAILAAVLLILFWFSRKFFSVKFFLICFAVFVFSVLYTLFRIPAPDEFSKLAGSDLSIRGQVVSVPRVNMKGKTKFHFQVKAYKKHHEILRHASQGLAAQNDGEWLSVEGKTLAYIYDDERKFEEISIGDTLELYGTVKLPYRASNPGEFDYGKYLSRKGIFTMTFVRDDSYRIIEETGFNKWKLLAGLNKFRNRIIEVHRKYLESPKLELLGGMVFGDYAVPTPKDVEDDFKNSGLLHLLAASGLNVGIIFGIWYFLASRARLPFRINILTGMVLVAVYSLLTGLPPSVTRAALMMEFVLFGKLLDRQADNAVLLVVVCVLMLLYNPMMATNVGFQMSFIVTLGLLKFVPMLVEKLKPLPHWLSGAFLVPFIAQIFVAPVQIFHFNTFAVYSVLANMVVLPFVGIISFSGFLGSIFALVPVIGEKICFLADKVAEPLLFLLLYISKFTAELSGSLQYLPKPDYLSILSFYILLTALYMGIKKDFSSKKVNIAILVVLISFLVFAFKGNFYFGKKLEFVFFDVGEGDSILVKTPNEKYLLVDTGPYSKYSPAKTAIIPYLRDNGIKKLDALLLTHPDMDHTGGTLHILKDIKADKVYHNGVKNDSKTSKYIAKYFAKNAINPKILRDGDRLNLDKDLQIQVVRPENILQDDDNEDSLILYITYKDFSALLMADCEAESLPLLKKTVKPNIDLLKVGHHGSYNSVNNEFMQYMKPEISVISVGKRGYQFNHPHPLVIKFLKKYDTKTFRTDKDCAITVSTNGHKIKYKKYKR